MIKHLTPHPPRETVIFFPAPAQLDPSGDRWNIPIHGWIFHPEESTKVSRASFAIFRRYLQFKTKAELNPLFRERAQAFFYINIKNRKLKVRLSSQEFITGKSVSYGHFRGWGHLPRNASQDLREGTWVNFETVSEAPGTPSYTGRSLLVANQGVSVVSDIDDTIKHSHVHDRKELLANTFLREFQSIPDMADLYQAWTEQGALFHYVSSSPWQLYQPLEQFLLAHGFPMGTFHLRLLRLRDSRFFRLFSGRTETKSKTIEALLYSYPRRKFILIGDSGERDPEIYGSLARRHPTQIAQILIRSVEGRRVRGDRFGKAFHGVPLDKWTLYRDLREIRSKILHLPTNL